MYVDIYCVLICAHIRIYVCVYVNVRTKRESCRVNRSLWLMVN